MGGNHLCPRGLSCSKQQDHPWGGGAHPPCSSVPPHVLSQDLAAAPSDPQAAPRQSWIWGGRAAGMGQHWQRGLGREQCRDTQPETRTAAPLHTQTASETPKAGHLNNCWGKGRQPDRETEPPPPALRQHPAHSWCTSRDPCLAICSTCCFNYPWRSRGWQGSWEKEEEEEGAGGKGRGDPAAASSSHSPGMWKREQGWRV